MSHGYKKRIREVTEVVEKGCGFTLLDIKVTGGDHFCCKIRDDAGNVFKAFTGQSCSANIKKARLNFRQDIRRISNTRKGLIG